MKKFLLLFSFVYITFIGLYAQNLQLVTDDGSVVENGDTIQLISTDANTSFVARIGVKNNSSASLLVYLKKIELSLVAGSENSFCWSNCYFPDVYYDTTGVSIAAGVTNKIAFFGEYNSMGNSGKSYVMYVFYNSNNPNDSISYVVEYYAGSGVGIKNAQVSKPEVKVFPNPAKDHVNIDYIVQTGVKASFQIKNILGTVVYQQELISNNGKLSIDVSHLNNGVYFYSILINDKVEITRKLVVQ